VLKEIAHLFQDNEFLMPLLFAAIQVFRISHKVVLLPKSQDSQKLKPSKNSEVTCGAPHYHIGFLRELSGISGDSCVHS
jgi:hypothetical protein